MGLSKEALERQIKGCEAAVEAHKEGVLMNELVLKALKEEEKKNA